MTVGLGARVKDPISGLTGIAVSRTEFLYGCVRVGVQPEALHDGKPIDQVFVDEPQLEVVAPGVIAGFGRLVLGFGSEQEAPAPSGPRSDVQRTAGCSPAARPTASCPPGSAPARPTN